MGEAGVVTGQGSGGGGHSRVLAVDDDPHVLSMLSRVLAQDGFEVTGLTSAVEALDLIKRTPPDIILLDVNLAGRDGFGVLAELRHTVDVPVILVTGRGAEPDRVLGLRLGADDYVVKPFSPRELAARIRNILRRRSPRDTPIVRTFGPLAVDVRAREVRVDGELVATTAKEFDLLAFLTAHPRQVFSREQLLRRVWDSSADWQDAATVTEHVRRLRTKIEPWPTPRWLVTVRGVGYRFEP